MMSCLVLTYPSAFDHVAKRSSESTKGTDDSLEVVLKRKYRDALSQNLCVPRDERPPVVWEETCCLGEEGKSLTPYFCIPITYLTECLGQNGSLGTYEKSPPPTISWDGHRRRGERP